MSKSRSTTADLLRLTLTDSIASVGTTTFTRSDISSDGRRIFAAVVNTPPPASIVGDAVAQLYRNVHGRLVLDRSLLLTDPAFSEIVGGAAAPDFRRFAIADSNVTTTGRVRLLNADLVVVATLTFPTPAVLVGAFTRDGRYLLVLSASAPTGPVTVQIYRVGTSTLTLVASTTLPLLPSATRLNSFRLAGRDYFASTVSEQTPAGVRNFVDVLQFDRVARTIALVAQAPLPQSSSGVGPARRLPTTSGSDRCGRKSVRFGLGTGFAWSPGQPTVYANAAEASTTHLPGDTREWRLYDFSVGSGGVDPRLELAAAHDSRMLMLAVDVDPVDVRNTVGTFEPEGPGSEQFNVSGTTYGGVLQLGRVVKRERRDCRSDHADEIAPYSPALPVDNESRYLTFSENGRWLLQTGCKGPGVGTVQPLYHNVSLYRVSRRAV